MDSSSELLKALTEAHGVPGYENEVRALVRRYLEGLGDIEQDRIGSLICRQGEGGPRVMLAGHMDEIGFMVNHITDDGFLRFLPLGGWWDQVLLGQRVIGQDAQGRRARRDRRQAAAPPARRRSATSWSKRRTCTSTSARPARKRSRKRACAWATRSRPCSTFARAGERQVLSGQGLR